MLDHSFPELLLAIGIFALEGTVVAALGWLILRRIWNPRMRLRPVGVALVAATYVLAAYCFGLVYKVAGHVHDMHVPLLAAAPDPKD